MLGDEAAAIFFLLFGSSWIKIYKDPGNFIKIRKVVLDLYKDPVSFIKITTRPPGGRATTLIFIKISARHWPPAACRELKRCLYDLDIAQPDANTT